MDPDRLNPQRMLDDIKYNFLFNGANLIWSRQVIWTCVQYGIIPLCPGGGICRNPGPSTVRQWSLYALSEGIWSYAEVFRTPLLRNWQMWGRPVILFGDCGQQKTSWPRDGRHKFWRGCGWAEMVVRVIVQMLGQEWLVAPPCFAHWQLRVRPTVVVSPAWLYTGTPVTECLRQANAIKASKYGQTHGHAGHR